MAEHFTKHPLYDAFYQGICQRYERLPTFMDLGPREEAVFLKYVARREALEEKEKNTRKLEELS
jgi:hypothetical protein